MSQYDSVLKVYAESGLRTVEDWVSHGRDLEIGVKPRLDAPHHGGRVPLFSRDQTRPHTPTRPKQP